MSFGVQLNASSAGLLSDVQRDDGFCLLLSRKTLDFWNRSMEELTWICSQVLSSPCRNRDICSRKKRSKDTWCFMVAVLVALCHIIANSKELELCILLLATRMKSLNFLFSVWLAVCTTLWNEVLAGRKKISLCFVQSSWLKLLSHLHLTDSL